MKVRSEFESDSHYQALLYLINKIISRRDLRQNDFVRINRLLYMLWLEYASVCVDFKIPKDSAMNKLEFIKFERGPGEKLYYYNNRQIYRDIKSGNVPNFSDSIFSPSEYKTLEIACSNTRKYYSTVSTDRLCDFISLDLPHTRTVKFLDKYEFERQEFMRELNAFLRNRPRFYGK